jgi:hypothetical protein
VDIHENSEDEEIESGASITAWEEEFKEKDGLRRRYAYLVSIRKPREELEQGWTGAFTEPVIRLQCRNMFPWKTPESGMLSDPCDR